MAFRNLTRGLFQVVVHRRMYSSMQRQLFSPKPVVARSFLPFRSFASAQKTEDAYKDLNQFLEKEIQLEKTAQKHPSTLPKVAGFESQVKGPEVTLTRQSGSDKVTVKFNVTNTVNANESDAETSGQQAAEESTQASTQLKSRPTFTVDINRGGQTLSFLCSYLPDDFADAQAQSPGEDKGQGENESSLDDFQIDEFAIHDGEWNEKVYSADCAVIDGELYDKLLNLLEEHGIGEEFANQLIEYSTGHEHREYIGLLEKLHRFSTK